MIRGVAMPSRDLACREFGLFVTAWLDGALAPDDRAAFEGHRAACQSCATYLAQIEAAIAAARAQPTEVPAGTWARMLDLFRDRETR